MRFVGTDRPEDHRHSSDESVEVRMLLGGVASIAQLWTELEHVGRAEGRPAGAPHGGN